MYVAEGYRLNLSIWNWIHLFLSIYCFTLSNFLFALKLLTKGAFLLYSYLKFWFLERHQMPCPMGLCVNCITFLNTAWNARPIQNFNDSQVMAYWLKAEVHNFNIICPSRHNKHFEKNMWKTGKFELGLFSGSALP